MPFQLNEILKWTQGDWVNESETQDQGRNLQVTQVASLAESHPESLAFFFSKDYQADLPRARAGILITGRPFVEPLKKSGLDLWKKSVVISTADPYFAMAVLSSHFAQETMSMAHVDEEIAGEREVHPTAIIHSSAKVGRGVRIGAHCVVEADVTLGEGTILYPGVYIGTQSRLGSQCILYPRVSVYEKVVLGSRVRIHAGAVIGADGFGYAPMVRDGKVSGHQKIYHCGGVLIEDDVEIGANACVDRGTFGDTKLGRFVKIDNMVQIGHNAVLDEGAVVCGSAALAGSSSLGKYSYIGGLTGISNKVHVGDYAKVGALSLMTKDVPAGTAAVGNPQREYREHFRAHAEINRLIKRRRDV